MSNGRSVGKRDTGRDPGGFVAIPWSVLDSAAYRSLSHTSRSLLLEVARQYSIKRDDNGRMLLSGKYLATRGWNSPAVIQRAKKELIDSGLIYETCKGGRPNRASWYAVTWYVLDRIPGYDYGAWEGFERGAYRKKVTSKVSLKNASVTTSEVVAHALIATSEVVETPPATTSEVAILPVLPPSPTTPEVHPLRITISGVDLGGGGDLDVDSDLLQRGKSIGAQKIAQPEQSAATPAPKRIECTPEAYAARRG